MKKLKYKQYESVSNKIKNIYSKKNEFVSPKASAIKSLIRGIEKKGLKNLNDIKSFIAQSEFNSNQNFAIVTSILNAKQDGKKIYLNTNLFTKPIKAYYFGNNVKIKCLTNDYLNLMSNCVILAKENQWISTLLGLGRITLVKVTTENFYLNEDTMRGYIQDYDRNFSAMVPPGTPADIVENIIEAKPNLIEFGLQGKKFICYGNSDVCIVTENEMSNEDAISSFKDMKYLKNNRDGELVLGFRKVYTGKDNNLYYIDKDFIPEQFCPAFWFSDKVVSAKFLFEIEFDYNKLFGYLSFKESEGPIEYPENLCYWDTINECFQFLSVFLATWEFLKEVNKENLINWCDTYFIYRPIIMLLKTNQLLLQRILQDFIYSFHNNSDYKRFTNLLDKINKYIKVRDELKKNVYYKNVISFFSSLPFAQMINKQLTDEVMNIAEKIRTVVVSYIEGKRPAGIVDDIRSVVKSIVLLMPQKSMSDCTFPILVADGGILGNEIKFNDPSADPLLEASIKNARRILNSKNASKQERNNAIKLLNEKDSMINTFLANYLKIFVKREKLRKPDIPKLIASVKRLMTDNEDLSQIVTEEAFKYKISKNMSDRYKLTSLDYYIKRYILNKKNNDKIEISDEEDNEEDDKDEEEDIKSDNIQSNRRRYNLRERK